MPTQPYVPAMLPTGAGKSLVYMLPAMLRAARGEGGVTVVVAPLLSLMHDQIQRCEELEVEAEVGLYKLNPADP